MSDDEPLTTTIALWRVGVVMHIDGLPKATLEEFFESTLYGGISSMDVNEAVNEFADEYSDSVELWANVEKP